MSRRARRILAIVVLSAAVGAFGLLSARQPTHPSGPLDSEALRADVAYLKNAVLERHPRYYQSKPSAAFTSAFDELLIGLQKPMTQEEAFRHIARLNPIFEDAHTLVMPTFVRQYDSYKGRLFPIAVKLNSNQKLEVIGDWVRDGASQMIVSGSEITSINGVPTESLLKQLSHYGHGESAALRTHMLTVMFPDWLAAINGWHGRFLLEVEARGESATIDINTEDQWKQLSMGFDVDTPSVIDLKNDVFLLRLPTFDVDDDPEAYRAAITEAFKKLKSEDARSLIIDVRGNTGGQSEAGEMVIQYLIDRPVNQVSSARERLNDSNRGLFGYKGVRGSMRQMDLSRDGLVQPVPADARFKGNVALLIDAMTYSAGILFATTLQDHRIATIFGQPTAGFANQTGNMEEVRLPNSGLLAYIPSRVFIRPNGNTAMSPVIPDVIVPDEGKSQDNVLEAARTYLLERQLVRKGG